METPRRAITVPDAGLPWYLGIDLGTGSCKSVIVDEQLQILGFGAVDYAGIQVENRWQEQNPQALMDSLVASVQIARQEARANTGGCAGISIGGALHSLLALGADHQPLTGVMTWVDGRALEQGLRIRASALADDLYRQTGCPAHGMYPLCKILWLKEQRPEVFLEAAHFLSAKEYIIQRLTGEYAADYSLAAGSGLLNAHQLNWHSPCLDLAGIREEQLSTLYSPQHVFHHINPDIALRMGLPSETPLVLGSSDAVNSNLGAGAVLPNQAVCMIGTSGAYRLISPCPLLDDARRTWCYAIDPQHWLVGGAINNGGIVLSWFKDLFNQVLAESHPQAQMSFEAVLSLAGQAPPGADGLICLPLFAGERSPGWNLDSRACFIGLTLHHEGRHLARALLEGIAFRMRSMQDALEQIAPGIDKVVASGGYTQSSLWLQTVANILGRNLVVPAWGETSSLGAALWAMIGTGRLSKIEQAPELISIQQTYQPQESLGELYTQTYELFNAFYKTLQPYFSQLGSLSNRSTNPSPPLSWTG